MDKAEGFVKAYSRDIVGKHFELDFFNAGMAGEGEARIQQPTSNALAAPRCSDLQGCHVTFTLRRNAYSAYSDGALPMLLLKSFAK